jgi:tRNA/rRNA methyltransferase
MSCFFPNSVAVVLVQPQSPGNIGMVCRAMANFGLRDLRLVNPCRHLHPEARKFAVGAAPLLDSARLFTDLPSALADLHLSVAATRRRGRLRGELLDSTAIPGLAAQLPATARLGLVFGREDAGLTSEEVALCTHGAAIATTAEAGSLNLAQAVLVFLYELARQPVASGHQAMHRPAQTELEPLFEQIERVLTRIAFLNPSRPEAVMHRLRAFHHRACLEPSELSLWRGVWTQLAWSINNWRGRKRGGGAGDPKTG